MYFRWGLLGASVMWLLCRGDRPTQVTVMAGSTVLGILWYKNSLIISGMCFHPKKNRLPKYHLALMEPALNKYVNVCMSTWFSSYPWHLLPSPSFGCLQVRYRSASSYSTLHSTAHLPSKSFKLQRAKCITGATYGWGVSESGLLA